MTDQTRPLSLLHPSKEVELLWTDQEQIDDQLENSQNKENALVDLLSRNSERLSNPVIVQIGSSLGELYTLNFPFSDIKKIRQVINPELEDLLPFEPNLQELNISIQLASNSGMNSSARVILLNKDVLRKAIKDVQFLGHACPLFLYSPLVTEVLLKEFSANPFICLEYNQQHSYLYIYPGEGHNLIQRALVLTDDLNTIQELVLAQIAQHNISEINNIIIINKSDIVLDPLFSGASWNRTVVSPMSFIAEKSHVDYSSLNSQTLSSSILAAVLISKELGNDSELDESFFKNSKLLNLRDGEFKYRAPFSEFKENLYSEVVPFSLSVVFLFLFIMLGFIAPLKEINVLEAESLKLISEQAPDLAGLKGKPLDILANEIINLEGQIGGLTTMRSLSPFEWLYKLSSALKPDVALTMETLSITSSSITFRGSVPDYPSSGRLDSMLKVMLKENQGLLCKGEVNADQGSSAQKVSITGILELCQ